MPIRFNKVHAQSAMISILLVGVGAAAGFKLGRDGSLIGPALKPARSEYKLVNIFKPSEFEDIDFQFFWEVWQLLELQYLKPEQIIPSKMVHGAISGMVASLSDPYTSYLPPEENKRTAEDLQGSFYGVGIQLGYIDQTLAVITPLKGSPAEQSGVQAGDLILKVIDPGKNFDEPTTGWSLSEAVTHIRGERGTSVTLNLYRPGQNPEPFDVEIKRDEILVPSVEVSFVDVGDKRDALLEVSRFGERTNEEWNLAVTQILAEKSRLDGVVLDMRNNPGGVFDEAINMASEFVGDGVIVTQSGRYDSQPFYSTGRDRLSGMKLVVLVNKGSASASEIVAGALRDRLGVKLVGQKTFGKGTVQDRHPLSNEGAVHITVARWLLPGGSWIHEEGIPVDIEVDDDPETEQDEVLERAVGVL